MDRDILKVPVGSLPQHKIEELIAFLEDGNNIYNILYYIILLINVF